MRIGFFADMYKPHTSGVTNYIAGYKRRFEELGHEVFVFTYGNRDFADDEPGIVRSPAIAWGDTGWQLGRPLSREARRLIPTLDVAHVQHPFLSGSVALAHCRPHGIPIVFTNHTRYDLYSDVYARFVPRAVRYAYLRHTLATFARRIDLVICPSQGIREWLAEFGVTHDALLLPNSVDTRPFASPPAPLAKSDLGIAEESVLLAYVGRLGHEKNVDVLLDAFLAAAEKDERLALLLIGDGPARAGLERTLAEHPARSRVVFSGMQPHAHVPDLLAAADAFVTASVTEVHPLVVLEAMAAHLPVLGVVSPGVADTVEDGVTGLLAPVPSAHELTQRMLALASDAGMRERLAQAAGAEAARYDVRVLGDALLREYERVIATRRG